tara:strand:- start:1563 stop:1763 length:201 start_codon:yes stop_codon:yes gene_type:complete
MKEKRSRKKISIVPVKYIASKILNILHREFSTRSTTQQHINQRSECVCEREKRAKKFPKRKKKKNS